MESEPIIVGGEESGGLSVKGHVPEKDGILACLLMAELVATEKKSLGKILEGTRKENGRVSHRQAERKGARQGRVAGKTLTAASRASVRSRSRSSSTPTDTNSCFPIASGSLSAPAGPNL
jgi:phosphomannomutase